MNFCKDICGALKQRGGIYPQMRHDSLLMVYVWVWKKSAIRNLEPDSLHHHRLQPVCFLWLEVESALCKDYRTEFIILI